MESTRENTVFLRFLAIVLVINSHMDSLYPIPIFATGGSMGNSLFFMLSSFGLLLSEKRSPQTFVQYYVKRLIRIYPVVWTSIVFLILPITLLYYFTSTDAYLYMIQTYSFNDPLAIIGLIFYPPKSYWFLQALMFFYLMGFFLLKNYTCNKIIFTMILLLILYIIFYAQITDFTILAIEQKITFKLIFYAMVFLSGIYFASIRKKIIYKGGSDYLVLISIISLIYLHKFLWMKGILTEYQFIQQLLIFPMLFYFMKISHSPFIIEFIMKSPVISAFVTLTSAMTIELYLVHGLIRPIFREYIPMFPENVIIYLFFVALISFLFYKGNNAFTKRLIKINL